MNLIGFKENRMELSISGCGVAAGLLSHSSATLQPEVLKATGQEIPPRGFLPRFATDSPI
jgi:hypothetical protein